MGDIFGRIARIDMVSRLREFPAERWRQEYGSNTHQILVPSGYM
jgi:hypothetical protein